MYNSLIDLLCDGDYSERDRISSVFNIADAEILADAREKAAAELAFAGEGRFTQGTCYRLIIGPNKKPPVLEHRRL